MKMTTKIAALLFVAVALFSSCEEEITTSKLVIDESQTATMKLYVKADMNNLIGLDNIPNNTVFNISVPLNELNGYFYGDGRWTTSVQANNGIIEFDVPANADGVTVYVDMVGFESDYTDGGVVTEKRFYEYNGVFYGIITGSNNVDVIYPNYNVLNILN